MEQVPYDSTTPNHVPRSFQMEVHIQAFNAFERQKHALRSESDLHVRHPGVFPRFWNHLDSELLITDPRRLDSQEDYSCIQLPIGHSPPTSTAESTEKCDESESTELPSKRPKTAELSARNMLDVYLPSDLADWLFISSVTRKLKDSAHRSEAIAGFVVTALGGVLHVSYPPTLEQLQLYCEVISIYDQHSLRVGVFVGTFAYVLNSLHRVPTITAAAFNELLDSLFEFVWVRCSQSSTCLALLAPFFTTCKDQKRITKRIKDSVALNSDAFINFLHLTQVKKLIDKSGLFCFLKSLHRFLLPEIYRSYIKHDYQSTGHPSSTWKREFYRFGTITSGDRSVGMKQVVDDTFPIPSNMVAIASSIRDKDGKQSTRRSLAHKSVLELLWPYFDVLMKSGLSESRSRLIELPLSVRAINLIVRGFYCVDMSMRLVALPYELASEIISNGPQLGFFAMNTREPTSPLDVLHTQSSLISVAVETFFSDRFVQNPISCLEASIRNANESHQYGYSEWANRVIAALVEGERTASESHPTFAEFETLLHPDLLPVLAEARDKVK